MKKLFFLILSVILISAPILSCSFEAEEADAPPEETAEEVEPQSMDIASMESSDTDVREETVNAFVEELSLGSKIAQLLIAVPTEEYPASELTGVYQTGGVIFSNDMLEGKLRVDIINQTEAIKGVHIEPFVAIEEEGGEVSPIGGNLLVSDGPFGEASELYAHGGVYDIETDAQEKSEFLKELGFNLNLCPVANVVEEDDPLYERTFKTGPGDTAKGVCAAVAVMNDVKMGCAVKYYTAKDSDIFLVAGRTGAKSIVMAPFEEYGMRVHKNEAAYKMLRSGGFDGVIIADLRTDEEASAEFASELLDMGCDMMITDTAPQFVSAVSAAVSDGRLDESVIDNAVKRVLLWKYDLELIEAKGE